MLLKIRNFVQPFYQSKDIMHDMSHLDRIKEVLDDLANDVNFSIEKEITEVALYFHGIIYSDEEKVIQFLNKIALPEIYSTIQKLERIEFDLEYFYRDKRYKSKAVIYWEDVTPNLKKIIDKGEFEKLIVRCNNDAPEKAMVFVKEH